MNILVFGTGVIGTIYGNILAESGNRVTHYVRPGKKTLIENGIRIQLLDGRSKSSNEREVVYRPNVVESLSSEETYDLCILSVRHYQLHDTVLVLWVLGLW